MNFHIYCPCSVRKIGTAFIGADPKSLLPYYILPAIISRFEDSDLVKTYGTCRHCGDRLKIVGRDKRADRKAGITKRMLKQEEREAYAEQQQTPDESGGGEG